MEQTWKDQAKIWDRITATVYGNGQSGLTTRMTSTERNLNLLNKIMWSMAATLLALGIKAIFDKLVMG